MTDTGIIGIQFEFSHDYDDHLARIFESVTIEEYTWYVSCSENYVSYNNKSAELFLPNGIYTGYEFASIIRSASECYVHLLRLVAVPVGKKINSNNINCYEDYVKSAAEIVLLSGDSIVSFYAKDKNILRAVFDSCKRYYSDENIKPQFVTLKNDSRVGFWV